MYPTISVFSQVSAHLRVSAHPHFLVYVQMASPCKRPPHLLAVNFKRHGRLLGRLRTIGYYKIELCNVGGARLIAMARTLQLAFKLRTLSHSLRALRVSWSDGVESTYPSTWLRASVRDPEFFDDRTCEYLPKHFPFISAGYPIVGAEQTDDQEFIKVEWGDHTSSFSAPWLRVQDVKASRHLFKPVVEETLWVGKDSLPEYHYSEKEERFESWMRDLRQWGVLLVHGCPTTDKGFLDFMQMVGVPLRRKAPCITGVHAVQNNPKTRLTQLAFSTKILEAHTDEVEYSPQPRLGALLSVELDAPVEPTKTFVSDAFKAARDLKEDNPRAFDILSSARLQHGRRRVTTEEDCEPSEVFYYEWDTLVESPVLLTDSCGVVKQVITRRGKNVGLVPGVYDEEYTEEFYRAYQEFHDKLNSPHYRKEYVLRPGMMLIYDNYRLAHGRLEIHPTTTRMLKAVFIPEDGWRSRWRFLLGQWSGLDPKWCYGCSDEALNILAQRKLTAN